MDFKIINDSELSQLYPNNYDEKVLRMYSLMDNGLNAYYRYLYSCYHYFLDMYLEEFLDLKLLNQKIIELNVGSDFNIVYNDISCCDLKYVFVRNNIFLERLSRQDYVDFVDYFNNRNVENIKKLVERTYKKLITFDINLLNEDFVNYGDCTTFNNALVIGIAAKRVPELEEVIRKKEIEYSKKLNIPVTIVIFEDGKVKHEETVRFQKYLPLGSVVTLKNGIKRVMIMGYSAIDMDTKSDIYDYVACFYPEGVIRSDYNILFNHDDIHDIHALGFVDDEQKIFMNKIRNSIDSEENKKKILNSIKNI